MSEITIDSIREVLRGINDTKDRVVCLSMLASFKDANGKIVERISSLLPGDYEEFMGMIKDLK